MSVHHFNLRTTLQLIPRCPQKQKIKFLIDCLRGLLGLSSFIISESEVERGMSTKGTESRPSPDKDVPKVQAP